jgi:hypothetical protein
MAHKLKSSQGSLYQIIFRRKASAINFTGKPFFKFMAIYTSEGMYIQLKNTFRENGVKDFGKNCHGDRLYPDLFTRNTRQKKVM